MSRYVVRHPFHLPATAEVGEGDEKRTIRVAGAMKERGDELTADEVELVSKNEPHLLAQNCIRSGSHAAAAPSAPPAVKPSPIAVKVDDSK